VHAQRDETSARVASLRRALVQAALLVGLDAFVLNQGAIAALVALPGLLEREPRTFLASKYQAVRAQRLRNIGVYAAAVVLVFVLNAANNSLAEHRAERVIAAVKAFRAEQQRYPKSLGELLPRHIEEVPSAKLTAFFNGFWYWSADSGASLMYVAVPPFGRRVYSFETGEWSYID